MNFKKNAKGWLTEPFMPILSKTGLSPNAITWIGLIIILVAASFTAWGYLLVGGILVLLSGFFDILDGALARYSKQTTKFGAVLDSTFDRMSEAFTLLGLTAYFAAQQENAGIVLSFAVMIFSFLISYIRARAEGVDMDCEVGLFTRVERVIITAAGLIIGQFIPQALLIMLGILLIFSLITVIQRLVYVYKHAGNK